MFWHIVLKELKELRRDKKSFWFIILFPTVLLPLLIGGATFIAGKTITNKQAQQQAFAIEAPQAWQNQLGELLQKDEQLDWQQDKYTGNDNIAAVVNSGDLSFVLQLPNDFDPQRLESQTWQLHYNQADDVGQFRKVEDALTPLFEQWQQDYQQQLGLTQAQLDGVIAPVVLDKVGTAEQREDVGEKIGGMLPYMLIFLCMMGAMIPALDIGAGEKERGTLETLLLSPQSRRTIILAKYSVVTGCSITVALLTVISGLAWTLGLGQALALEQLIEAVSSVGLVDLGLVLLCLLPIAMILSALMLIAAIYARTYKEAQSYIGPMQMVAIIPAMIAIIPGTELTGAYLWSPIVNVMVASKELVKGTMDYWLLLPIGLSNLVTALALLAFCVYWFSQEKVLFR